MPIDGYEKRMRDVRDFVGQSLGLGKRITQEALGKSLGLSADSIGKIETGMVKLSAEIAVKIEEKYGIDLRWLITGEGEMIRNNQISPILDSKKIVLECGESKMRIELQIQLKDIATVTTTSI